MSFLRVEEDDYENKKDDEYETEQDITCCIGAHRLSPRVRNVFFDTALLVLSHRKVKIHYANRGSGCEAYRRSN
jgi:hypothetical protein